MENCKCIYIYQGDDTDWNGDNLLTVHVNPASEGVDITSMTAKFILGSFEQTYSLADDGVFQVDLSAAATGDLPFGPINGTIRILDEQGRIKTAVNTIPLYVTSEVITTQNQDLDFSLPEVSINVNVGGTVSYNNLSNKPTLNGVTIEGTKFSEDYHLASEQDIDNLQTQIDSLQPAGDYATQTQLEEGLATKQDVISDLAQIRSNAELGASAVQPATLASELATKQDTLNASQLTAVNSGVDSVKVAQIATNATEIGSIESKIPTQASASNQLADKDFVNSSINSLAAFYITSDAQGDPFPTRAALVAGPWYFKGEQRNPTQNDYALVTEDETHDDKTSRFMYDGTQWVWQYDLNNTTFTAEQIAAINSGITSALVTQIGTNESAITSLQNSKQDVIGDLSTIRSGASAGATAVQPTDVATASTVGLVKPDGTTTTVNGEGTLSAVIPNNIWTQDNLKAGDNVTITPIPKPVIDSNTLGVWHLDTNTFENAVPNSSAIDNISTVNSLDTTNFKFGPASAKIFSGSAWTQIVTNLGIAREADVTLDFWYYPSNTNGYTSLDLDGGLGFKFNGLTVMDEGQNSIIGEISRNQWHHFAAVRKDGICYYFIDGVKNSYTKESSSSLGSIGILSPSSTSERYDELRVSNVARWTEDFTPYTEPYAASGGTTEYQINATTNITVDSALSTTSENPVQNKVVTSAINSLYDTVASKQDTLPAGTTGYFLQKTATGVQWAEVQAGGAPTLTWYTGNTGTSVTISDTSSADLVKVYKNGILLEPIADYSISGTTLTLVTALVSTDKITVEEY